MRRLSISSLVVTVFGVLVLAGLLLNSGGQSAQGAVGVADSVPGSIATVAIDMDPTAAGGSAGGGNPVGCVTPPAGALSSIDTTATVAGFGSHDIDIVVDEIDAADGMSGFSYNLLYDDSVIGITAKSFGLRGCLPTATEIEPDEGPGAGTASCDGADGPDTDVIIDDGCFGNFRMDAGSIGGFAIGEGVLVTLTLTCKVASGESFLDLTDIAGGDGLPDILDGANFGAPLTVLSDGDAHIGCGVAPSGAIDLSITSETIHGPASMAVNTPTTYTVDKSVTSDSLTAVGATLGTGIIPPADCTAYADPGTYADPIDSTPVAITGVALSTPTLSPATDATVTTAAAHGLSVGDTVIVSGVVGAVTEASSQDVNHIHTVSAVDVPLVGTSFDLAGVRTVAAGAGGSVSRVIGTAVPGLTSAGATPSVGFGLECSEPSFHDVEVTNEIFHDAVKTYGTCDTTDNCSDPIGDNSVSHSTDPGAAVTVAGANGTTLAPAGSPGPKARVAVTASADADITSVVVSDDLADNDNGVAGDELLKGDTNTVTLTKTITLVSSDVIPVTFELDTTPTTPAGCTTTPNQANPTDVLFGAVGAEVVVLTFDISCTTAGTAPTFIKSWDFDETLTPKDPNNHVIDPDGAGDVNHEDFDVPVIEPFNVTMNIDQSSTDDPATTTVVASDSQCLTTLGCEQLFEDETAADPMASVMYVDFPKASPGYTVGDDTAVPNGTTVGELLGTTTVVWGAACGSTNDVATAAGGTAPLTNVNPATAATVPEPLATTPGTAPHAQYTASIGGFGGLGNALRVDIVIYDGDVEASVPAGTYRQYRVVSGGLAGTGTLGGDWSLNVCKADIYYDLQGLAGAAVNIRSCDDVGSHTFDSTWTRDDTGGTYTATEDLACAAADVSVTLDKDEIIGDNAPGGDIVDQGVATTRDVTVTVAGPPDTATTVSIVGPVECAPRWVSPLDPAPAVLNGLQTSVVTVDPSGAGAFVFTYEVTCSPAGNYSLQIVANVSSVSAGAEANTLNNQAENNVQVIVLADSDGDGVDSPEDNCPNVPNPNQHDADSDGEGNVCDINDDNDFVPILANAAPPVVASVVEIFDAPIAIDLSGGGGPFAGPDQCNPGVDLLAAGPDLDALSAAELALWQEDNDDFVVEVPVPGPGFPGVPNFALDLDGCADTDMSVEVDKEETFEVGVSQNTPKTVTITVTNGNAAVGNATVNVLALSRLGKCDVHLVAEAGDLASEFETDELTLTPPIDGPGGSDDYDPTPDGILDTIHSQLSIATGPMAAGEVLVIERDYTIHCYQPSDQYWWDSTKDLDFNFDSTFELQVDVLPDAPVVEEDLADNVHKNFPLVTANALADIKYNLTITGPDVVPVGELVDIEGFSTIHNNGPAPADLSVYGNWITPPGCSLFLGGGLIVIPPGIDTSVFLGPVGFPIVGAAGTPLPPSVEVIDPIDPGSSLIICIEPSFHTTTTTLTALPEWPVQVGAEPESGDECQNFIDDDGDGITNDGCPNHIADPDLGNNTFAADNVVAAVADTSLVVATDLSAVPDTGKVSEDEFFDVTKTVFQSLTPFYNPFLPEDGVVPDFGIFPPFLPCANGIDDGPDLDGADTTDADCYQGALPGHSIFPLITETLTPPADCSVSFHVTNSFLSKIVGGAAGLTISIDGVPQSPPTPAGWEASDVVKGAAGESVSIDFKLEVDGLSVLSPLVITENWDKHCFAPSTHDFVLNTSWTSSDMDDPHLPYDGGNQDDPFSEDIFADSDLKIVTDFFLDLQDLGANAWLATYVPANGAPEAGNACEDSVDNDGDGVVNDGCPTEGHQKEALHNNGPYGPTAATVNIVATVNNPADCNVTYDVRGDETSVNGLTPPAIQPGDQVESGGGGVIDVEFPANLPVSTDVWFAELWRFTAAADGCIVTIDKTVTPDDIHILDADGATFTKTVEICIDTDDDGVHDSGDGNCNGPDNCPDDPNPGQEDTDGDGAGDVCDDDPNRPPDDGVVKYVIVIGPAAINLSDTTGRYMWVIAEVGNQGSDPDDETVTVTMEIAEDVPPPAGCERTPLDDDPADGILNEALVLPGQDTFTLLDEEQKFLVWRLRYECHEPATSQTFDQTVTVTIDLAGDGNPANDSQTVVKTVIVH